MSWPPPNYHPERGTGYRVTFEEFTRLVNDPYCRPSTAPLLKEWFGYEIPAAEVKATELRSLHEQIQSDPRKQYYLYQQAMDLWR